MTTSKSTWKNAFRLFVKVYFISNKMYCHFHKKKLFQGKLPLQQQLLLFLLNEQLAGMEWNGVGILSEQI